MKEAVFETIVNDFRQRIYRICCYYARNDEDRKDLLQEVLISIWKSLATFRGEAALGTWVYRVTLNTAISYTQKELRRQQRYLMDGPDQADLLITGTDDEQQAELEEMLEELYSELNQLPVIDRTIMTLYLERLPSREIARIVGITEPNVRTKIHRICSKLSINMKGLQNE